MPHMFDLLQTDPPRFFMVVVTVTISIVLHELAHGWMAIRLGDDTPLRLGRMTGNPMVHMGPFSLIALCLAGIAWGQMPVDSTRLRGRHAESLVAVAGPATNLLLALVALTALGLVARFADPALFEEPSIGNGGGMMGNLIKLLFTFGTINMLLCIFNLMPVPPLDGSRILASYHRGYAIFIDDPTKQGFMIMAFCGMFMLSQAIFAPFFKLAVGYATAIAGSPAFQGLIFF